MVGFDVHQGTVNRDGLLAAGGLDSEIARHKHTEKIVVTRQDIERTSGVNSTEAIGLTLVIDLERRIDFRGNGRFAV